MQVGKHIMYLTAYLSFCILTLLSLCAPLDLFGGIADQDTGVESNEADQQFAELFFQISTRVIEGNQDVAELCRQYLNADEMRRKTSTLLDPTRVSRLNKLALAVAYVGNDHDRVEQIIGDYVRWVKSKLHPNSHFYQTALVDLDYSKTIGEFGSVKYRRFAKAFLKVLHLRIKLGKGDYRRDADLKLAIDEMEKLSDELANLLGNDNWYSLETIFYRNRMELVSSKVKQDAEWLIERMLKHKHIQQNHLLINRMRISIAKYEYSRGRNKQAIELAQRVNKHDQELGTPNENSVLVDFVFADIERMAGNHKKGYLIGRKAIERLSNEPVEHLFVRTCEIRAEAYSGFALMQQNLGDLESTGDSLVKAKTNWRKVFRYQPSRLIALKLAGESVRLSRVYSALGKPDLAIQNADDAMESIARYFDPKTAFYQNYALLVSTVYARTEKLGKAKALVDDVLVNFDVHSKILTPEILVQFIAQANFVLQRCGEYDRVFELLTRVSQAVSDSELPSNVKIQLSRRVNLDLAAIELRRGNRRKSFELTEQEIRSQIIRLPQTLLNLDESETLVISANTYSNAMMLLAAVDYDDQAQLKAAWECLMLSKRLGSELLARRDRMIGQLDEDIGDRYQRLRAELSSLALRARSTNDPRVIDELKQLEEDKNTFFADIEESIETSVQSQPLDLDIFDHVVENIPANVAMVEIVKNSRLRKDGEVQYQAFVLTKDEHRKPKVALLNLGAINKIDSLVGEWRSQFVVSNSRDAKRKNKPVAVDYEAAGIQLFQTVWKPIAKQSPGKRKFIISGDGQLGLLPWSTLPNDQTITINSGAVVTGRLVDEFQFFNCMSFRSYADIRKKESIDRKKRPLASIFANIDYGEIPSAPVSVGQQDSQENDVEKSELGSP